MATQKLAQQLRWLATDLYVSMEIHRIVRPARHRDETLRRLCLHAREYYERTGGLPVHIILYSRDSRQVLEPEETPEELLLRVASLLKYADDEVWRTRGEYHCQPTLSTLGHSCNSCTILRDRDYSVVASICESRRVTRYGVGETFCVYDFDVDVHLWS
jgi:hypothetical protein